MAKNETMKILESGATRSSSDGKFDYEGFINPGVLFEYAKYLHKHRVQTDGRLRDSDNWQKGMESDDCMKPLLRHTMDAWLLHRGYEIYRELTEEGEKTHVIQKKNGDFAPRYFYLGKPPPPGWVKITMMDALCGILFNTMGYMLALIRGEEENGN